MAPSRILVIIKYLLCKLGQYFGIAVLIMQPAQNMRIISRFIGLAEQ